MLAAIPRMSKVFGLILVLESQPPHYVYFVLLKEQTALVAIHTAVAVEPPKHSHTVIRMHQFSY
jgi:hypothetical protein